MAKLSELQIDIVANTSDAEKALKDVSKTAEQVGKGLETLASNLNGLNHQNLGLVESSLRHVRDMVASIGGASIKITVNPIHDQLNNITKEVESVTKSHWNLGIGAKLNSDFDSATKQAKSTMDGIKDKKIAVDQTFDIKVGSVDDTVFVKWKSSYDIYANELLGSRALNIKIAKVDDDALTGFKRVYSRYRNALMNDNLLREPGTDKYDKAERVLERLQKKGSSGVTPIYVKVVVDKNEFQQFRADLDTYRSDIGGRPVTVNFNIKPDDVQSKINTYKYYVTISQIAGNGTDLKNQVKGKISPITVEVDKIAFTKKEIDEVFRGAVQNVLNSKPFTLRLDGEKSIHDVLKDGKIQSTFAGGVKRALTAYTFPIKIKADEKSLKDFIDAIQNAMKAGFDFHIDTLQGNVKDLVSKLNEISKGVTKTMTAVAGASDISGQIQNLNNLLQTLSNYNLNDLASGVTAFATAIKSLSDNTKKFAVPDTTNIEALVEAISKFDAGKLGSLSSVIAKFGEEFQKFSVFISGASTTQQKFGWVKELTDKFDVDKISQLGNTLEPFARGVEAFFKVMNASGTTSGSVANFTPYSRFIVDLSNATANIGTLSGIIGGFGTKLADFLSGLSNISSPSGDLMAYSKFLNSLDGTKLGAIGSGINGLGKKIADEFRDISNAVKNVDTKQLDAFTKLIKEFSNIKGGTNIQGLANVATTIQLINAQLGQAKNIDPKISPLVALGSLKAKNVNALATVFENLGTALMNFFNKVASADEISDTKIQALERISAIDFTQLKDLYKAMKAVQNAGNLAGNGGGSFGGGAAHSHGVLKTIGTTLSHIGKKFKQFGNIAQKALKFSPSVNAAKLALKGLGEACKVPFKLISSGAKTAVEGLKRLISHFTQAGKSSLSLGEKFTRMVASFWAIRRLVWIFKRVFGWIKESALSAMNFIESYHFFDMVTKSLGEKKYEQVVKENAEFVEKIQGKVAENAEKTAQNVKKSAENIKNALQIIGNNDTVKKVTDSIGKMWNTVSNTEAGKRIGKVFDTIGSKAKDYVDKANSVASETTSGNTRPIRGKSKKSAVSSAISEFDQTLKENQFLKGGAKASEQLGKFSKSFDEFGETLNEKFDLKKSKKAIDEFGDSVKEKLSLQKANKEIKKTTKSFSEFDTALKENQFLKGTKKTAKNLTDIAKAAKEVDKANKSMSDSFEKVSQKVDRATYSSQRYANEIKSNMLSLNEKMTGYTYDEDGNATLTGQKSLGMDADMLLQYQGTYAQMASGMGLAADEATIVSNALSMLAGDWSSLRNVSFESSFQKMTQALAGQSRAVRSLGIDISQARLQQLLYDNGIDVSITKLNNAQKTELRMIAILEQSKLAYGDLAKTINTPANQLRMLEQNLKNLSRAFGNLFIPMLKTVLPYLNGVAIALTRIFQYIGSLMGVKISDSVTSSKDIDPYENIEESADDAEESVTSLKRSVQGFDQLHILSNASSADMGDDIQDKLDDLLNDDYQKYLDEWSKAFEEMQNKAQEIADKIMKAFERLKEMLNFDDWGNFGEKLAEKINEWIEKLKELLDWENLKKIVEPWINRFTTFFNGLVDKIDWYNLGQAIGNGLNSWIHIITEILEGIDWVNLGKKLGEGLNGLIDAIDWDWLGRMLAAKLNVWIDTAFGFLQTFHWNDFGKDIGTALTNMIKNIHWDLLAADFGLLFNGVFDAIDGFLDTFSFEDLGKTIADFMNNAINFVDWEKNGKIFGRLFNDVFKGIHKWATEFKWNELGNKIGNFMVNAINAVDWEGVGATFKELFFGVFKAINGWFEAFDGVDENGEKTGLKKIGKVLADFLNGFIDQEAFDEAAKAFDNAFNGIFDIIIGFWDNFKFDEFMDAFTSSLVKAIEGIQSWKISDAIRLTFNKIFSGADKIIHSGAVKKLAEKIGEIFSNIDAKEWKGWLQKGFDVLKEAIKEMLTGLGEGLFPEGSFGRGLFEGVANGVGDVLSVIEAVIEAISKLASAIANLGGKKFDIEGNLVDAEDGEKTKKTLAEKFGGFVGEAGTTVLGGMTIGKFASKLFGGGNSGRGASTSGGSDGGIGKRLGTYALYKTGEILTNPATWGLGAVGAMTTAKAADEYKHLDQSTAVQPIMSMLNMRADIPEETKAYLETNLKKATSIDDYSASTTAAAETLKNSGLNYDEVYKWASNQGINLKTGGFSEVMGKWQAMLSTGQDSVEGVKDGIMQIGDTFTKVTTNGTGQINSLDGTARRSLQGRTSQVESAVSKGRELVTVGGEVTATYKGATEATEKADHVAKAHNDTVIQGKSNVVDFGQTAVETFTDIGMVTETSTEKFSQLNIEASKPLPDNYSQYLTPLLTQLGVSKEGVKNLNAEIDSGKIPIQSVGDLYDVLMAKFGGTEENVSKINGIFSTYFGTEMPSSVNTTQGAIDGMSNALGNVPSKYEALEGAGTQAFGNVTTGTQDYDAILQKVQSRIADPSSFQSLGFNSEQANAYLRNELGLSEGEIQTFWQAVQDNEAFDKFVKNDQTAMQEATRQVGLSDDAIKSMFGTVNDPTGFDNFQKFSSEANNFLRNEFGYSDEQIQAFWRGIANGSETSQELMGVLVDVMAEHLGMMGVDVGELGKKFDTDLPQSVQTGVEEVTKSLESLTGDLGLSEDELGIEIFDPTGTMSVFEKAKISDVPYYKPLDKVKNALSSLTTDADKTKSNVIGSMGETVKGIEDKGKDFSDAGKASGLSIESGMASAEPEIKKTASSLVNTAIGEAKTKSNEFATVGTNGISAMTAVMGKDTSLATATKTLTTEKMINTAHDVLTKDATGAPFLGREFDSKLASGMNANSKALDDASRQAGNNIFAPFREEAFITDTKKLGEDFDSNVGAGIDNNVDKAKTPAKNLKDGIVAEFDSVSSDIADKFGDIGTAIQNTLNGVDMQSCVDILSSKFSGLPLAVANQFGNFSGETLVSLQNAGQAFATNFGNYVTSAMSTLKLPTPHYDVTSYNSVDNGNGGSINVPVFALNWYARGGFPRSGELFVANEAGPEMVGKMGSGTAVANNLQIIEGIAQGVASSLRSFVPYITEGTKDAVYGMKDFFSSMVPYITDSAVQTAVSLAEDLRQTLYDVAQSTRNDNYVAADRVEWCMRESFNDYRNYDATNTHQVADELSDRLIEGLYSVTRDTTDYIVDNLVDARGNGSADGKPYVMNINLMIDRDVVVRQVQEGILGQQDRMVNSY